MDKLVERLLGNPSDLAALVTPLSDDDTAAVVERLKREADRHWWIDAHRSLELAELIVQIGRVKSNLRHIALGTMARGDALKFLGQIAEAWEILDEAGRIFQAAGDEVGWARTRIGRLLISVDLNHVSEALADGERAKAILTRHNQREILLRLHLNTAILYDQRGDHHRALDLYHEALGIAESLGETGQSYLGALYTNIGYAYNFLGDFRRALDYYERARAILLARGEVGGAAITELNMAYIYQAQGAYRRALNLLHQAQETLAGPFPLKAACARRVMVECYLALNRYREARDLAQQVVTEFESLDAAYEAACALRHLAAAEAALDNLDAAQTALDAAAERFAQVGAAAWIGTVHLRRGRIALRLGDLAAARREAEAAAACFESQQANYASAILLQGQIALAEGDLAGAAQAGRLALHTAQQCNMPSLRYSAHLLLGLLSEAQGRPERALREYRAGESTIERVQRGLTITLRPGFLEDKGEAQRSLIRLHLRAGRVACAFETLERAKSQILLGYLANRDTLKWADDDPASAALVKELDRLRAEHHWYYRLAHEPPAQEKELSSQVEPEDAIRELAIRERRMRAISEQLYLRSGERNAARQIATPSLRDIQTGLDDGILLVEYYNDGVNLWAFTLDRHSIEVHSLPITVAALDQLIGQFQFNIACALKVGPSPVAANLTPLAVRLLQRLYSALIEPLAGRLWGRRRLVVVPYGALHYLPMHLLHTGRDYLIEDYEVVTLPAAGLMTHRGPRRIGGALALAHSWNGRLPQTVIEAERVWSRIGGVLKLDQRADRAALFGVPRQILHIAAHGEHRIEQPDLSYIQLADGQLYTDDLLQHDLSYELVTLSACETGRANVTAGDELIGLGRGFLYAGAGALIASLWRVNDASTVALMDELYRALEAGESKAAALRQAQQVMRSADLHPAFWGAFVLVGDAAPLSTTRPIAEEQHYVTA